MRLPRIQTLCVFSVLVMVTISPGSAATSRLVRFTIDAIPGAAVSSDSATSGTDAYTDYRLPGGDPCVDAEPMSQNLFVRLNRKLDGETGSIHCSMEGGVPRQFTLTIADPAACTELLNNAEPSLEVNLDGSCTLSSSDNPRIRVSNLYAARATKTPVAFLITTWDRAAVWEVRTDVDAKVAIWTANANFRSVTYAGTAHLWKFTAGTKAKIVGNAFPLPLQMTFEAVPQ